MEQKYIDISLILKAISDPKRLRIVDMLSCGELCACEILEKFHITQPTLSHDMKLLIKAGLVNQRPAGKWTFYSLNHDNLDAFYAQLGEIFSPQEDCICYDERVEASC